MARSRAATDRTPYFEEVLVSKPSILLEKDHEEQNQI